MMQTRFELVALIVSLMTVSLSSDARESIVPGERGFDGAVRIDERRSDGESGYVTVTIPYRNMRGETALGQARLYFKHDLFESRARPPVYCSAYYPLGPGTALEFCDLGYVVVTPHDEKYSRTLPFGDSYNLNKAMLQWVRRLDCVDRLRLQIGGASAGGYMTLAMGSEIFPLSALVSDLPAVNWAYGINYLFVNQGPAGSLLPPEVERPLPVLAMVAPWGAPAWNCSARTLAR